MNIVQLARCAFGHHLRDRLSVVSDNRWHRGRCKGCGVAMVKTSAGWQVERRYSA